MYIYTPILHSSTLYPSIIIILHYTIAIFIFISYIGNICVYIYISGPCRSLTPKNALVHLIYPFQDECIRLTHRARSCAPYYYPFQDECIRLTHRAFVTLFDTPFSHFPPKTTFKIDSTCRARFCKNTKFDLRKYYQKPLSKPCQLVGRVFEKKRNSTYENITKKHHQNHAKSSGGKLHLPQFFNTPTKNCRKSISKPHYTLQPNPSYKANSR